MRFNKFTTTLALASVALAGRAFASNQAPHDFGHNVTCNDCHIPSGSLADPAHLSSGTATGGTTLSLIDSGQSWTTNAWVGGVITFTSGAPLASVDGGVSAASNNGQFRTITANDGTSIGWADPLPFPVASGDKYTINLVTYDDIEVKCKSCHQPGGMASDHPTGGLHNTGVHSASIGCGKCHEPHNIDPNSGWSGGGIDGGTAGANLIRTGIRRPDGTIGNIVYSPGVLTQPAGNGVCQTCHTTTPYYRNDGTLQTHHVGENCVSCHSHEQQFFVNLNTDDTGTGDHFDTTADAYTDAVSGACMRCHTDLGFQDYIGVQNNSNLAAGGDMHANDTFLSKGTAYPIGPMTCQSCHNSVSDPTIATAGLTSVEFVSLKKVNSTDTATNTDTTVLDKSTALCSQCHQGRESTASVSSKIATTVAAASRGLSLATGSATGAGTTTTIVKSGMTAGQYVGYTLVFTNNANQGAKVTVTANDTGTITFAPAVSAATHAAMTGGLPADTFTMWPTATGGGSDGFTGIRMGDQTVRRGTTLLDANRTFPTTTTTSTSTNTSTSVVGLFVLVQTGANAGLYRQIQPNVTGDTVGTIRVAKDDLSTGMAFPAPIAAGDRYQILPIEDTSVLDVVVPGISFTNSHYFPASAILHGNDAMIGYQNPRNMASFVTTSTATSTSSHLYATTSTATSTATGTVSNTSTATDTNSNTVTVTTTGTGTITTTKTLTSAATNTATSTIYSAAPSVAAAPSYSGKNLHGVSQDSCVSCHDPHALGVTVSATTCGRCHFKDNGVMPVASLTDLQNSRQFGFDGDIDGDGVIEGLKAEVDGMAAQLFAAILAYGNTTIDGIARPICYDPNTNPYFFKDNGLGGGIAGNGICEPGEEASTNAYGASGVGWFTPRMLRATFNYQIYVKEPGAWAHNPRYIIQMLYDALADLNMGLPTNGQVGLACVNSTTGAQTPVSTRSASCPAGSTLTFTPRRSFLASTHFDATSGAFRHWDTNATNAAPGLVPYPCMRCHGGQQGFENYVGTPTWYNQTAPSAQPVAPTQNMQCYLCHQPQPGDTDMKRMRDMTASAIGGARFPGHWAGGQLGAPGSSGGPAQVILGASYFATKDDMICTTCHNGRDTNGAGVDSYLAGVWSGIDVPGSAFLGTGSIGNNGSGNIRITGLPNYVAAMPPYAAPNNWVYDTTKTGTAAQLAVGKYITISNSINYNGTYLITASSNGTGTGNTATVDVAKAFVAAETGASWASFAAGTKNNHDIQSAGVLFGSDGHIGYEYAGKTYASRSQHHGATASCTECHSPKGSHHSFQVADSVAGGICANCHSGSAYSTWSDPARGLTTGPGYDSDPTTTTLPAELAVFVNAVGTALNQYTRTLGVTPAAGNICLNSSNGVKAAVGNTTGLCPTGAGTWGGGYDAKMVSAMWNLTMCTSTDPAPWAHNFNYCAELLYDSAVDLGVTAPAGPAGPLTRP